MTQTSGNDFKVKNWEAFRAGGKGCSWLAALPNPAAALCWLSKQGVPPALIRLACKGVPLDRLEIDTVKLFSFLHIDEMDGISHGPRQALASFSPLKWGSFTQF